MWSPNISPHVVTPTQSQTTVYSIFGRRVPDYGAVLLYGIEKDNIKMRFGVVISIRETYKS